MPDQIRRLAVIALFVAVAFIIVRSFFVPKTFGEFGHYRAAAVDSIIAQPIKYAGHTACLDCHEDVGTLKANSYHRGVNCEACHGPGEAHIASMGEVKPSAPRGRDYCILCHEFNFARPTGFPQIDPIAHNPMKPCIACHNPHAPDPPRVPGDCSACHAAIARTKAVSPHSQLLCTVCHVTAEDHKVNPRGSKPSKPSSRNDCGKCHSPDADSDRSIPRVDLNKHYVGNLCWQCHYPHNPEAKR